MKECATCKKEFDEGGFYRTYKGELSSRCKKCCDKASKKIVDDVLSKAYQKSYHYGGREVAKGYQSRSAREKEVKKKVKMYADYIADDVKRGNTTPQDAKSYLADFRSPMNQSGVSSAYVHNAITGNRKSY